MPLFHYSKQGGKAWEKHLKKKSELLMALLTQGIMNIADKGPIGISYLLRCYGDNNA